MRDKLKLIVLLGLLAAAAWWFGLRPSAEQNALRVRELATRGLAEYLARRYPGERVLVISNPFVQRPGIAREIVETEEAGVRGLRAGLAGGPALAAIAFPALQPEALTDPRALLGDIETTTPLTYLVAHDAFDQLVRQHPDCQLVVSLIGLPKALERCEAWQAGGSPRFALLWPDLRPVGGASAVAKAMHAGKLAAFVLRKPGAPSDAAAPGRDRAAEFGQRFLLVTPENVDELTSKQPELFPTLPQ
jgi:hypothetical protein